MGIYYYAVDRGREEYFSAPKGFAVTSPGVFQMGNPFPGMVVMMNVYGGHFDILNDLSNDIPPSNDYVDITEQVYQKYRQYFFTEKE